VPVFGASRSAALAARVALAGVRGTCSARRRWRFVFLIANCFVNSGTVGIARIDIRRRV